MATNREIFMSQSDEDLAYFIDQNIENPCAFCTQTYCDNGECEKGIIEWLNKEAK